MKPKVIVLLIMLAVAIAAIMTTYSEAEKSSTFAEADANPNETFHITGFLVKEKPMEYNPQIDPNYFSFYIKDKNGNIRKVVSTNRKQQDFERAETVNMYGRSDGEVFRASKVMPKCPSKYKDEQNNNSCSI